MSTTPFPTFEHLTAGARFYRADLQIHSYGGSPDVTDASMTPAAIIAEAGNRGIELIAVTDHNSIANVRPALDEAAQLGGAVTVIPGVEITTSQGHVLVYSSPTKLTDLETWLNRLDFLEDEAGERYTRVPIDQIATQAATFGGFAIPAHIGRENTGFLVKAPHRERQAVFECPHILGVELDRPEHALWFTADDSSDGHEQRADYLAKRRAALARPASASQLARVLFSDAHELSHVGRNRDGHEKLTRIKMDSPSFDGLRTALLDPAARVLLEEPLPDRYPRIVGIRYVGGFLDGQEIALAPNLTALIGGRGAGKSTALEALRCGCMGTESEISGSEAWPETVQIEYVDAFGERHFLQRDAGSGSAYEIVAGEAVEMTVPLEGYEQDSIAEIIRGYGDRPDKLLTFFDQYVDTTSTEAELARLRTALSTNAEQLVPVYEAPQLLKAAQEKLKMAKARIQAAEQSKARPALEYRRLLHAERQLRSAVRTRLDAIAREIDAMEPVVDLAALALDAGITDLETTDAKALIAGVGAEEGDENLRDLLGRFESALHAWRDEGRALVAQHRSQLEILLAQWDERDKRIEGRIKEIIEKLRAQGITPDLQALNALAKEEADAQLNVATLERQAKIRGDLLSDRRRVGDEYKKAQYRLTALRTDLGKKLTKQFADSGVGFTVGIKFREGQLVDQYEAWLRARIGNRFFRAERVTEFCRAIHPIDLADHVRAGATGKLLALRDRKSAPFFSGSQEGLEFVGVLRANTVELLRLETLTRSDRPEITLTVHQNGGAQPVAFENLSFGQKASILLGVVLFSDRSYPLVIDQPEDHLDNAFIYEAVVGTLRMVKERRQVVVATHNANIAVLGDAELLVPLRAWAGRGLVQVRGSVDGIKTRARACTILEGGEDAYRRRGEMYGLSAVQ